MRLLAVFVAMLLVQTTVFAQTASPSSNVPAAVRKTVDSLNDISYAIYLESPDSGRVVAERALILSEKAKFADGIGRSFLNIGHVYWSQSYYPIALMYLNRALMSSPRDNYKLLSTCYNVIGRIYSDLRKFKEAETNLALSEQYAQGDPDRIAGVYSERSLIYKRQGKYKEAIDAAFRALQLNKVAHDEANLAVCYGRLSSTYRLTGQYKECLAYSDTACMMAIATHNKRLRSTSYIEYAGVYLAQHRDDKAITYAKMGGSLADSIGVVDAISLAYQTLIKGYEDKHDLQQAMFYQKRYNKMQDSLNTFNKNKNTELIQDYFALDKRLSDMAEIERSNQENKALVRSQGLTIMTLTVSLIVVIVLFSITYYFYKQKKKFNERLNAQNEELHAQKRLIGVQAANLEMVSGVKDKLLAVIAHDLRTPMANLRNITDMFDTDILTDEEVHKLMKDINPMVKSAEMTLSNLLEWAGSNIKGRNINTSQLDIFLLGVEMEQVFSHSLQKKKIEYINQASPGQSVLADENHIKVVLRNLISNAIKFTDTRGRVMLSSTIDDDKIVICVEDNGKGMTEEEITQLFKLQTHFSRRGTQGESGTGIGLMLCKELVELNGGKLWVESDAGKGSKFYFSLPLNAAYV